MRERPRGKQQAKVKEDRNGKRNVGNKDEEQKEWQKI
jgi:hypothetical protein